MIPAKIIMTWKKLEDSSELKGSTKDLARGYAHHSPPRWEGQTKRLRQLDYIYTK